MTDSQYIQQLYEAGYIVYMIKLKELYWAEYDQAFEYIENKYKLKKDHREIYKFFEKEFGCAVRSIGSVKDDDYESFLVFESPAEALAWRLKWL